MSVNIFGSSGASSGANVSSGSNNKYVDQKFKTLRINLATKINKSGDTLTGGRPTGCAKKNTPDGKRRPSAKSGYFGPKFLEFILNSI